MRTTILDLLGVAFLAVFAWLAWPPLAFLIVGLAALAASWRMERG